MGQALHVERPLEGGDHDVGGFSSAIIGARVFFRLLFAANVRPFGQVVSSSKDDVSGKAQAG